MSLAKKIISGFIIISVINWILVSIIKSLDITIKFGFVDLSAFIESVIFSFINLILFFTLRAGSIGSV